MATFLAVLLKGAIHIKHDNTSNIKIRITHNRKSDYISTDLYVSPKKFKNGSASGENSTFINSRIRNELKIYTDKYFMLGSLAQKLTVKELKERLMLDPEDQDIDFNKFAKELIEEMKKGGREGTVRGFESFLSNLEKYQSKVTFQEINGSFLTNFRNFLIQNGVKNAVNNYLRYFRQIFNHGRNRYNDEDRGIIRIPNYPFRKFKIEKPIFKTKENTLSVKELQVFINYKPTREREQMAKDMFLLMFYLIGINSKDLFYIELPKNGRIFYKRYKTGREYSIKLEPEALAIIEKYKGSKKLINISERYNDYLDFRKYVNKELKEIGKAVLTKLKEGNQDATYPANISTNWARHTWATIARNDCRINKDDVALCLGHEDSDNRVTDIYIRYDYSIIDESNRKVLDMLKEKKPELPEKKPRGRKKKPVD